MAITYPYPTAFFADVLKIESVEWSVERADEISGTADQRFWQAELAPPLWRADVVLAKDYHVEAKKIAALVRKLHGMQEAFWLYDPLSPFPQTDPNGSTLSGAGATVLVHSVGAGHNTVRFKGLPAGYALSLGDKAQITFSGSYNFFCEIDEDVVADGTGITPEFEVFPFVPSGVQADDPVNLLKPACKMVVLPHSHSPGRATGTLTRGASFTVLERPW